MPSNDVTSKLRTTHWTMDEATRYLSTANSAVSSNSRADGRNGSESNLLFGS
jgi:hypothetical protein